MQSDASNPDAVNLNIRRIGGSPPFAVSIPLESTFRCLQDEVAKTISVGPFALKFITEDCTVLMGNLDAKLTELGVRDGDVLTMITDSARDYSRITGPEAVLKTGQYPAGLVIDKDGSLYVSHYYGDITVYDRKFQMVRQAKIPRDPMQLTLAPSGELVVAFNDGIRVFDPVTLKEARRIGSFGATGVAVEGDFVYSSSPWKEEIQVHQFCDGKFVGAFSPGLRRPQGLTVVEGRLLAVADRCNDRVILLNLEFREVQSTLPQNGAPVNERLSMPNDVIADSAGNLLVMDTGNERIAVFRQDGSFVASVMNGFFKDHGNTFSYFSYNHVTGAIAVSNNDQHCLSVFSPIFEVPSADHGVSVASQ